MINIFAIRFDSPQEIKLPDIDTWMFMDVGQVVQISMISSIDIIVRIVIFFFMLSFFLV